MFELQNLILNSYSLKQEQKRTLLVQKNEEEYIEISIDFISTRESGSVQVGNFKNTQLISTDEVSKYA